MLGLIIAPVGALVGVVIGSWLSRRDETNRWVREQRLHLYVELIDLLTAINRQFATELMVSTLRADSAAEAGHDFEGVEVLWHDRQTELEHLERRLSLLGGAVRDAFAKHVESTIVRYFAAIEGDVSEAEWQAIVVAGHDAIEALTAAARADLGIPQRPA